MHKAEWRIFVNQKKFWGVQSVSFACNSDVNLRKMKIFKSQRKQPRKMTGQIKNNNDTLNTAHTKKFPRNT